MTNIPLGAQLTVEEMKINRVWDKPEDWDGDAVLEQLKQLAIDAGEKVIKYFMYQSEDTPEPQGDTT